MAPGNHKHYKNSCLYCVKLFKWIPVVFISLIIVWSYYAYFSELCIKNVKSTAQQVLYLIFYHIFFIMLIWAYLQTIFTDIGTVPEMFKLPEVYQETLTDIESGESQNEVLARLSTNLPITNVNINGSVRYCDKCKVIKPDRAHHCSVCGECVLKMDHHCPWVNNCVGFTNYKFFILFLGYALLYCIYVAATTLPYFIAFWDGNLGEGATRFHILFLFFVALMFAISLSSLFGYHCYLVSENRTTLESFRAPVFKRGGIDKRGFHVGRYRNFQEVFGTNPLLWCVPIQTSKGNGITYPNRHML